MGAVANERINRWLSGDASGSSAPRIRSYAPATGELLGEVPVRPPTR